MNLKELNMSNFTIQDIFLQYGNEYVENHKLSDEQWKVFNAIRNCSTKNLGYHICTCKKCGEEYYGYNSCRNRHCPMCQGYAREKWIQKESSYLLDSKYFHIITTVPYELNEIFLYNSKICYNILFKATSESILELCEDPKWLGAKVGITSILHTWGQTMEFHPHIHSIVTGGGLKNNKWISCDKDYLFKVQVFGSLFRGKFLYYLKHEFDNLILNDIDIRKFGSQGQQRTAALSLKLSEIELVKSCIGDTPVLLLDDVLSELDSNRQNYLLHSIHDIQTIITCTGLDEFVKNNFQIQRIFRVTNGQISQQS